MGMRRLDFVSDELSEVSDVEEEGDDGEFTIDYEAAVEPPLPVRSNPLRYNNFSELKDDWESFDGNSNRAMSKRVRFNNDSSQGKRNIEELLQYANQLNTYLSLNVGKIDAFRSEWMDSDTMGLKPIGNETTPGTTTTVTTASGGSVSNFELSDSEACEPEPERELEKGIEKITIPSLEEILQYVRKSNNCNNAEENEGHVQNGESSIASQNMDCAIMEAEEAVEIFQKTIDCILRLSRMGDLQWPDTPTFLHPFFMKGKPAIGYQEFIARIQSKCTYNPSVFLAATFLLQTLYLRRNDVDAELHLRNRLEESQIHHLIIACVRVASKLMEDSVHSHQYFCKVCGISKRLLSKLEICLLTGLKDEQIMVTKKRLSSTPEIIDELMASRSNQS